MQELPDDLSAEFDHRRLMSIEKILRALEYLKKEAEAVEADDIVDILDSSFKMANVAYNLMWRHSLMLETMEGNSNEM